MIEVLLYVLIAFGSMVVYGAGMAVTDLVLDEGWDHPAVVLWPIITPFLIGGYIACTAQEKVERCLNTMKERKKLPEAKARLDKKDG